MDIVELREYCLSLPGALEDIKWGTNLVFSIKGKMFCITDPEEYPHWASVKTNPESFQELVKQTNYVPSPYLARGNWIKVEDINKLPDHVLQELVRTSYKIIRNKLPKKVREELPPLS